VHDILLKSPTGEYIQSVSSNSFVRDPTHPNTRCVLEAKVAQMVARGMTYAKVCYTVLRYTAVHYTNYST
jgi:hypothetical protein